ncbi:conserved hypothetical protein [Coccidioides posadasii str. Silveira]|uniref:Uncharacterized protein n=2 Tax=Coccidioides posadasii TaxID=199306 RepID=E9D4T4_COCPS|nr:conserved hypothetical protein [Coccidioides posadasii str. Silveira]KMM66106.1 hypothetical protein CPAG_02446 [Coccidioides posadasii RMSCC 3488]
MLKRMPPFQDPVGEDTKHTPCPNPSVEPRLETTDPCLSMRQPVSSSQKTWTTVPPRLFTGSQECMPPPMVPLSGVSLCPSKEVVQRINAWQVFSHRDPLINSRIIRWLEGVYPINSGVRTPKAVQPCV